MPAYHKALLLILIFIVGCKSQPAGGINIQFDNNRGCVTVKGLPADILNNLKADTLPAQAWQAILPVCKLPADTALKNYQQPINGRYAVTANTITFVPDTVFKHNQTYFARFYSYANEVTPAQMLLKKQLENKPIYTELIFKY